MFIYVLKNAAMPGLYKIGWSANPPSRAMALSSASGVPSPFEVLHSVACINEEHARRAELIAHIVCEPKRPNFSREFFRFAEDNEAAQTIIAAAFCAWRLDRLMGEWQLLLKELAEWPICGAEQ